jgi:hypothetical protein
MRLQKSIHPIGNVDFATVEEGPTFRSWGFQHLILARLLPRLDSRLIRVKPRCGKDISGIWGGLVTCVTELAGSFSMLLSSMVIFHHSVLACYPTIVSLMDYRLPGRQPCQSEFLLNFQVTGVDDSST